MFEELETTRKPQKRIQAHKYNELVKGFVWGIGFGLAYFLVNIATTEYYMWRAKQQFAKAGRQMEQVFKKH